MLEFMDKCRCFSRGCIYIRKYVEVFVKSIKILAFDRLTLLDMNIASAGLIGKSL